MVNYMSKDRSFSMYLVQRMDEILWNSSQQSTGVSPPRELNSKGQFTSMSTANAYIYGFDTKPLLPSSIIIISGNYAHNHEQSNLTGGLSVTTFCP